MLAVIVLQSVKMFVTFVTLVLSIASFIALSVKLLDSF
jgi:hypothetical protein